MEKRKLQTDITAGLWWLQGGRSSRGQPEPGFSQPYMATSQGTMDVT